MKKIVIAIAVALSSFATVVQATLKDHTWYTGSKVGWSQFHETGWYNTSNNGPIYENQLGVGIFSGYQINPYVGFEVGYDWLGRMSYTYKNTTSGSLKAHGVQLTAKLDYPITKDLDMYARLGGMIWHADAKNSIVGDGHDTGASPMYAGGIEWAMTHNIATRIEYQWVNNIGDTNTVGIRPDNSAISLGFSYRFGQQDDVAVVSPISDRAPIKNKNFTLKSNVLFDFNKAFLNQESLKTLDQLYTRLVNLDPKDSSIVVLGFADRIGSDDYNQNLSEKRAQSVVNYLISKGIKIDKISKRGMGKTNSVTGNTCDNVKVYSKLIECLALDRRVEIEIKGVKGATIQPVT